MRADLLDIDELPLAVVEQAGEGIGRGMIAALDRDLVKLDPPVDILRLCLVHHIVENPVGARDVDIDRLQPGLSGIGPDRGHGAVDPHIVVAGTAMPQRVIDRRAAVGDRYGQAEIMDRDAVPRRLQAAVDAAIAVDIEILTGDTLVDQQHDIAVAFQRPDQRQPDRSARRHDVGRALITVEQRIGSAGIAWRQAARAIAAADEQDAGQHQQDQQRRGDQLLAVRPARAVRAEPDAEQQQQRLHPADHDRPGILAPGLVQRAGRIDHADEGVIGHMVLDRTLVGFDQDSGDRDEQREAPAHRRHRDERRAEHADQAEAEQPAIGDQSDRLKIRRDQRFQPEDRLWPAEQQRRQDQQYLQSGTHGLALVNKPWRLADFH